MCTIFLRFYLIPVVFTYSSNGFVQNIVNCMLK
uniref:Uncharacterized protein n=1 Tax=Rhizophora mucronata TaxID=61149 RepID=A0A2P2PQF1_RHIMU